ncbi:MAG: MotA/TolQ/ExbB proton channel family protein [Desulfobacterales bacterium]|nr:MotA/TolQ/ExbB proton channel family protein [Desulfobacterales bacterium]
MLKKLIPISGIFIFLLLSGTVSELSSIAINIKSNLIILTGTLVSCLIAYPRHQFSNLLKSIKAAFSKNHTDFTGRIEQIEKLSSIRRTQGLLKLDEASGQIKNNFLRMGIEMIVDGYDRYTIFKTLEHRYDNFLRTKRSETDLINTVIKLMPIFGFVGTIIGLIGVLNNMGSPELIGKGVATALLTTFYGLLYANIVCLPISKKLLEKNRLESIEMALIIEGVMDIADKANSKATGYRLKYCVEDFYNDSDFTSPVTVPKKLVSTLKLS